MLFQILVLLPNIFKVKGQLILIASDLQGYFETFDNGFLDKEVRGEGSLEGNVVLKRQIAEPTGSKETNK